jgi:hypothetical protein
MALIASDIPLVGVLPRSWVCKITANLLRTMTLYITPTAG